MRFDRDLFKKTFHSFHEVSPWLFPALAGENFLLAVRPFIVLHFSAAVVDGLYRGDGEAQVLLQALWLSLGVLAAEAAGHILGCYVEKAGQRLYVEQMKKQLEKMTTMDYQLLESGRGQELSASLKRGRFQHGDPFDKLIRYTRDVLAGLFGVTAALVYLARFAAQKLAAGSGAPETFFMFGGFLVLAAGGVLLTVKNGERHNGQRFARFGKLTAQNRLYGFYRQNVFQNYKYGKEVRIFDERELIVEEFGKVQRANRGFIKGIGKDEGSFKAANSVVNTFLSGIACLYVGVNAYHKLISVGNIVKYSGAVAQFFTGLTRVAAGIADLRGNAPFLRQHYEFLDLEPEEARGGRKRVLPASASVELSFEHVYFRYPGTEAWTLQDVSFRVSQGDHIAMVGQNGSGKTTCIRLLLRLYRPEKGVIRLNGVDIQEYDIKEYWRLLSVVFQDFKLFSFRLWQNIAGSGAKREEAVWKALEDLGMAQRVREMYAGMDSYLYREYDEQGILLSGGEAQKLAIAKALYKDAPVFVMDEPSAALDPVSEAQLYEKTNTLLGEKTMIFISHRLSSCCFCDRILVLKDGVLLEEGSHEQLLQLGGEYQKLWEAQAGYYQSA